MKRFLINSDKFTGTAKIDYRNGVLQAIDCRDTDMSAEVIRAFKRAVPATVAELSAGGNFAPGTTVVEAGYRVEFTQFWNAYGKKINKLRCMPLYESLSDIDTVECFEGISKYQKFLDGLKGVRQKLDPENYIKSRAWQNEWQ